MNPEYLVNEHIRARTVRLLEDDQQNNVISFQEALSRARRKNLDLVVVAEGDPPICRILDADRFRFERKKAEKELARRQREMIVNTKEIQLRPVTDSNDITIKAKHAREFLKDGDKVKITVKFKGRERSHKDRGVRILEKFLAEIGEHKIDKPLSDGDSDLSIILASTISKAELLKQKELTDKLV